tara:strand:- start:78 stop:1217 length:1140 start_codon:yes stop_codon:yes gene_type:complete
MATSYKVLGQTTATTAQPVFTNLIFDPQFKYETTASTVGLNTNWQPFNSAQNSYIWQAARTGTALSATYNTGSDFAEIKPTATVSTTTFGYLGYNVPYNNDVTSTPMNAPYTDTYGWVSTALASGSSTLNWRFRVYSTSISNVGSSFTMYLRFFDSSNAPIAAATSYSYSVTANTTYQTKTGSETIPSNARSFAFYFAFEFANGSSTSHAIRFTDLRFSNFNPAGYTYSDFISGSTSLAAQTWVTPFSATDGEGWQSAVGANTTGGTAELSQSIIPGTGPATTIYTVPANSSAVVSSLVVANTAASTADTYRIAVIPSGQTAALKNYIIWGNSIAANTTVTLTLGITLAAGDKLIIQGNSSDTSYQYLTASAFGSEMSV